MALSLCSVFAQQVIVYYELQANGTITGDQYRLQLMHLNRALKEKRPQYEQRYDKVILKHNNTRLHVARLSKHTWKR